jgi:hypothetical protein
MPAPVSPQLPQQPAEDDAVGKVRTALTGAGLQVRHLQYTPASPNAPATLAAVVDANYTQPSDQAVLTLAAATWRAMLENYPVAPDAAAGTYFGAGQQWTKYVIMFYARVDHLAQLFATLASEQPTEQKNQAVQEFLQAVQVRVYDLERSEFVDVKDFVSKNFTGQ